MRNLLLFVLFLIGLFYARRALRRGGGAPSGGRDGGGAPADDGRGNGRPAAGAEIEQMVACVHCGLHVPESESVRGAGGVFCSEEHRRLGPRR